jgi:hypothetical protein
MFGRSNVAGKNHVRSLTRRCRLEPLESRNLLTAVATASIAGTVYDDHDSDLVRDAGEPGIDNVTLKLYSLSGGVYSPTGLTAVTNSSGDYAFENLASGTYRVVKTQPAGYFGIGAAAGTINGSTCGEVGTENILTAIILNDGDSSINNNFAEVTPSSVSGSVYLDIDGDGVKGSGEAGLSGITISLLDSGGSVVATTITDSNGSYQFTGLSAGAYGIAESHPVGYRNGASTVGNGGGTVVSPDRVTGIALATETSATGYNFGDVIDKAPMVGVSLDTLRPTSNAILTATATKYDADGDSVTLTFVWTVNGVVRRTYTSTTALTDTFDLGPKHNGNPGEWVSVTVTANDGTVTGAAATASARVVAGPTISNVVVTSLRGTMRWHVFGAAGVASSSLRIDGRQISQVYGPTRGNFSAKFGGLPTGIHQYRIVASDNNGHTSVLTGTFTVEGVGPAITRIVTSAGRIGWNAFDINGVAGCALAIDGVAVNRLHREGNDVTSGRFYFDYKTLGLSLGSHAYSITGIDKRGNVSTTTGSFNVTNVGPTIAVLDLSVTGGRIVWKATDANGVKSAVLKIDGRTIDRVTGPFKGRPGAVYRGKFGPLSVGTHTFTIVATDKRGFVSRKSGTITVSASVSASLAAVDAVFGERGWAG